ncbi:MAG: DUF3530 family protein [Pseudomonadota bacterium]|nr:DUF3530 family protein [Pseudomonadota bacterium]
MPIHLKLITLALGAMLPLALAQAQTDPPEEDTPPERHAAGRLDAAERLLLQLEADAELITLQREDSRFFLIFHPADAPTPQGNLLIMPDTGVGPGWVEQSSAISRYLAEHGWNTLILQPPTPPDPPLPERTLPTMRVIRAGSSAAEPAAPATAEGGASAPAQPPAEPAAEATTPLPFAEQVRQRLALARTELQQRSHEASKINVLLGIGGSAPWVAAMAVEWGEKWDLVMINPRPGKAAEADLFTLLPRLKGRVIDLYYLPLPGYPEAAPDARLRRRLARRAGMSNYHQSRLPGLFRGWQHEMPQLVRQLRGLMERILLANPEPPEAEQKPPPPPQTPPGIRNPRPARGPGAA